jgi:hypothetical protein
LSKITLEIELKIIELVKERKKLQYERLKHIIQYMYDNINLKFKIILPIINIQLCVNEEVLNESR